MNSVPHLMLDIDGVLATFNQYGSKKLHPIHQCYPFDKKCVEVLNNICEKVNPIIVISSDWKFHYNILALKEIFEWNGVNCMPSDVTGSLWGIKYEKLRDLDECRAKEILNYVEKYQINNWVAVDDLNLKPWIPDNFVICSKESEGIKQSGVKDKILKILEK